MATDRTMPGSTTMVQEPVYVRYAESFVNEAFSMIVQQNPTVTFSLSSGKIVEDRHVVGDAMTFSIDQEKFTGKNDSPLYTGWYLLRGSINDQSAVLMTFNKHLILGQEGRLATPYEIEGAEYVFSRIKAQQSRRRSKASVGSNK